jgi:RNA polymerase sigma factor (sigma-70 family)
VVQLEEADIAEGWSGFRGRLIRKGFSPRFIEDFGEDLFAEAELDVLKLLAEGKEVYTPPALLIHCAWRRTQNHLDRRGRRPQSVSLEAVVERASGDSTPDEEILTTEFRERMREAISHLPQSEREVIRLVYGEGMSCREAGKRLGWGKSKAHRKHADAMRRLRPFFEHDPP